ncbi:MAG: transcriptional regulator [Martelella sp.]|nr:transcriptional regulator [Martelella sp.]|tara:strand:+ start:2239 stop:3036 length:798 start_codon:yes stop_codon:yes gene_type:complete
MIFQLDRDTGAEGNLVFSALQDDDGTPRQAAQAIADALIGEIIRGEIAVGDPLPTERDLCVRFDASRPTVREALAMMQLRGYLSGGGGRRPRAASPSLSDVLRGAGGVIREILGDAESIAHLEQTRGFIEIGAVREATIRADSAQIRRIHAAVEANEAAIGTPAFPGTDIAFHRALVSVVDNPIILTLHDLFVSELLARRPPDPDQKAHDRLVFGEHQAIFQAMIDADVVRATDIMEHHMRRSYRSRLFFRRLAAGEGSTERTES